MADEMPGAVLAGLFLARGDDAAFADIPWRAFRDGVEIHPISQGASGMSSALLRYAAGAKVPRHRHVGYEHIVVMRGSQSDHRGTYPAGTLVVNAPDTQHAVWSDDGCIVYVVWEHPVEFVNAAADA